MNQEPATPNEKAHMDLTCELIALLLECYEHVPEHLQRKIDEHTPDPAGEHT